MPDHTVKQGESLSTIAREYGLTWDRIYDDPKNADFKKKRPNPNIIHPGDKIFIPEKEEAKSKVKPGKKYRFKDKDMRPILRIKFMKGGNPYAGAKYSLKIDDKTINESTNSEGIIEQLVPDKAKEGKLVIGEGDGKEKLLLKLNQLDPVNELSGVQARLNNLAFDCGKVDGKDGPKTQAGVKSFQERYKLSVDGIAGPKTQKKLEEVYGA